LVDVVGDGTGVLVGPPGVLVGTTTLVGVLVGGVPAAMVTE
jgi:hypothetical protein